jgi:phospho-N-acetylmuramoyl-pentapeptide-transferase
MLYHIALFLRNYHSLFNVVHYVSFRVMASLLTALSLFFIFGSWFLRHSRVWFASHVREYTPDSHKLKEGMPTMGGIFILSVVILTSILWCNLTKYEVWIFLACLAGFGVLGWWDDWYKLRLGKGISERHKFIAQLLLALVVALAWVLFCHPSTAVCVPFFKQCSPHLGIFFVPWVMFLLVGTSNAVNLTDGLDGLAIGSLISNFATFTALVYISGHAVFARYLNIPFTGNAELAIIGATLVGASLGFLWYNTYPAQIFMGDVGSLALGSGLALMALMAKQELLLAIAGGLFVLETLSVIAQVYTYKTRKKRILKMAPLHHHFELQGWHEPKITIRFAIISCILCLIALMTIKLR